jgi:hypothetical protein
MSTDALDTVVDKLERTAAELRAGDLDPARAAALVDECARLAAEAGAALDSEARTPPAGQLPLT